MKAALDSNVIVSGVLFSGNEERVLEAALTRQFELISSDLIFREVEGVLGRKFGRSATEIAEVLWDLRELATIIDPPRTITVVPGDHPDNRVLECAVHAEADYLVTGDRKHLLPLGELDGVRILRAPDFLAVLDATG